MGTEEIERPDHADEGCLHCPLILEYLFGYLRWLLKQYARRIRTIVNDWNSRIFPHLHRVVATSHVADAASIPAIVFLSEAKKGFIQSTSQG
jgi:hypothetical protein